MAKYIKKSERLDVVRNAQKIEEERNYKLKII